MKRIAIFGPNGSTLVSAAAAGLRRLGLEVEIQNISPFSASTARMDFGGAVVVGDRGKATEVLAFYKDLGRPVIQIRPALLGEADVWTVGTGDPSWLPGEIAGGAEERLAALDLEIETRRRVKGLGVLVLGQPATDALTRSKLIDWAADTLRTLRALTTSAIYWRPDPSEVWDLDGADEVLDPAAPLQEAIDVSYLVVTHSAKNGLDFLVAGLPVAVEAPVAYSALASSLKAFGSIKPPKKAAVERLLLAILSAQWTEKDIASGEAFRQPLAAADDRLDLDGAEEEPEEEDDDEQKPPVTATEPPAGDPAGDVTTSDSSTSSAAAEPPAGDVATTTTEPAAADPSTTTTAPAETPKVKAKAAGK